MGYRFSSQAELRALVDASGLSLPDWLVAREAATKGVGEGAVREEIERRIAVTRTALERGLSERQTSVSGMTDGAAYTLSRAPSPLVRDELFSKTLSYAIAVNEVNACSGRVVAFPTAGSCGIVPGALWAWRDSRGQEEGITDGKFAEGFLVASAIGIIIATKATLSGAEGGCQAECGSAGAMAAAALAWLSGASMETAFEAAALSLKNSLGLACDPVAGLVEVPCVKRNGFVAVQALTAATLALSGVTSRIPFDEVVTAMKEIGDSMPESIRESARGGCAVTPTGLAVAEAMSGKTD